MGTTVPASPLTEDGTDTASVLRAPLAEQGQGPLASRREGAKSSARGSWASAGCAAGTAGLPERAESPSSPSSGVIRRILDHLDPKTRPRAPPPNLPSSTSANPPQADTSRVLTPRNGPCRPSHRCRCPVMPRNTVARMRNTLLRGENSLDSRSARRIEINSYQSMPLQVPTTN